MKDSIVENFSPAKSHKTSIIRSIFKEASIKKIQNPENL
jgi:hypothetical protein